MKHMKTNVLIFPLYRRCSFFLVVWYFVYCTKIVNRVTEAMDLMKNSCHSSLGHIGHNWPLGDHGNAIFFNYYRTSYNSIESRSRNNVIPNCRYRITFIGPMRNNGSLSRCYSGYRSSDDAQHVQSIAAKGSDAYKNHQPIVGGDIDSPPGILHSTDSPEIRQFTRDMWDQRVPLKEAVERLTLLDEVQPGHVMDNFMNPAHPNEYTKEKSQPNEEKLESESNLIHSEDSITHNPTNEDTSNTSKNESSVESCKVPGIRAPTEYIDEETFINETRGFNYNPTEEFESSDEEDSDDEYEVNYAALTSNEKELICTLLESKIKEPSAHKEIIEELSKANLEGMTEEECRGYFDRFERIGNVIMELSKTVNINPLETNWISIIDTRIRKFITNMKYKVASIRYTKHDIIVEIKDVITEDETDGLHKSLTEFIYYKAGIYICPRIKKLGLLLYTGTPDESE
ncbi:hypothetical protein BBOV_III010760 [Babesia bovis T2Bo]|uniref:Uncharacterized protein n=1 Tax=Babesia bovis TaxID=5865 RepID=A7APZ4_BABBO|nr:hypothetical protein BBOV_III010760 [Babesia bovis T2Bo]EDO08628.1 hypothetical protein BBOV_III010760 [Babesia bovis T2Bo]|eukprot:XP_001612196.1 hypothetical protein [Babesia bovis T2Bo]